MTAIQTGQFSAVLSEGAAVRLNSHIAQSGEDETHVYFTPCDDAKAVVLPPQSVEGMGRTLDISMTLRDVYPNRRVAVGIAIYEVDDEGGEHPRGFRAVTLPAQHSRCPAELAMPTIRFVLPEDIRILPTDTCEVRRHFVLRTSSHYIDTSAMCVPDPPAPADDITYEPTD